MSVKIFSGSTHKNLSDSIASLFKKKASPVRIERFPNSECKVTVSTNVQDDTCIVIQSTNAPTDENLMELVLFCDALKRSEASRVIGIIPYMGYTRQDRQHAMGECVSINVVARILETIGFDKIYTVNMHSESSAGIFTIPFKNIDATGFLAKQTFSYLKKNKIVRVASDCVIVAPDHGAIIQARHFAHSFDQKNPPRIAVVDKERKDKGSLNIHSMYGDTRGKVAILVDDVVVSGGTLLKSSEACMKQGAKSVFACTIHHDLTPGALSNIEKSGIIKLFTTDSIRQETQSATLIEFPLAKLLSNELRHYF